MFMTCDPKQCLPPEYVEFALIYPLLRLKHQVTLLLLLQRECGGYFLLPF